MLIGYSMYDKNNSKTIMRVSEAVAVWNTYPRRSEDFMKYFKIRYTNEIRHFTKMKSELYDLRYKYDDNLATPEDIVHANQCVVKMNICLTSLKELDIIGKERTIKYVENPDLFMANKFVVNFKKGYYDKIHNELCKDFTESKILQGTELR